MAAISGPGLCKNGDRPMSKRLRGPTSSVETGKVPAVRVKLKEVNYQHAIPYTPDGQAREWWQRLKNAFGTTSSAFVEASLYQLIAAARLPGSGICEMRQPTGVYGSSQVSRCGAKTRAGTPCRCPPVPGRTRCRLHGGLSPGAPRGSRNGNYTNGEWTAEAIEERRWLRLLVRDFAKTETGR